MYTHTTLGGGREYSWNVCVCAYVLYCTCREPHLPYHTMSGQAITGQGRWYEGSFSATLDQHHVLHLIWEAGGFKLHYVHVSISLDLCG